MPRRLRRYDVPGHVHVWTISCYRRLGFFHDDRMKRIVCDRLGMLPKRFGVCHSVIADYAKKLKAAVADVIAAQARNSAAQQYTLKP